MVCFSVRVYTENKLSGTDMKFPGSTSCLLFFWLLVELPVLAVSRPTPAWSHREDLRKLFQQMWRLMNVVQGGVHHFDTRFPFEHNLTSLPTLNFRPTDLAAVKVNSTLLQLRSGLQSFELHFDWLLYWHDRSGLGSDKIKEIADTIRSVSVLKQRQTDSPTPPPAVSPPAPTSVWDLHRTAAVIHTRLLVFCNWYLRALKVLIHHANK